MSGLAFSLSCAQPLHVPEGRGIAGVLAKRSAKLLECFGIPAPLSLGFPI